MGAGEGGIRMRLRGWHVAVVEEAYEAGEGRRKGSRLRCENSVRAP